MISIIAPIYNEEKALLDNLSYFEGLAQKHELIFVDGESRDQSVQIALGLAKVISSKRGRALQMNHGARFAQSDILLFLHADNQVSLDALQAAEARVKKEGFIGGCFSQRINRQGAVYRLIEGFGNIRARATRVFYGDQGIFVRKDIFFSLKGFAPVPIMEDVLFTQALRKSGRTVVLAQEIIVSSRRWDKHGVLQTILLYSFLNILFWLHFPLRWIKSLYDDLR